MISLRQGIGWGGAAICAAIIAIVLLVPVPEAASEQPLRILDRNGSLLYEVRGNAPGSKEHVPLAEIPGSVIAALVTTEDRTFNIHAGVSIRGIASAALRNLQAGRIVGGGSTITQQLVRVRSGSRSRTIGRKLLEMISAVKLDAALTKEQILEEYLNTAYFGHQAYGIAAAALIYFGKAAHELSLPESALLIGLLQSPASYDPFSDFAAAKKRQRSVLQGMREHGDITPEEAQDAGETPIRLAPDRVEISAPHFVFWALNRDDLPAGPDIRTTLDLDLQRQAEDAVARHLETLRFKNVTSAAVVVLDSVSGDVLAMVGSSDYFDAEHDGAVNVALSPRQPGSAIKPFTYALALTRGDTAATTVADVETQFFTQEGNPYIPRNYDYGYHGLVRYREALGNSYNIAAVNVLERVGVGVLLAFLRKAGITSLTQPPEHYGLALTLGDAEVSLLELMKAYGVFARGGTTLTERVFPGEPEGSPTEDRILTPEVSWLISDILSDDDARLQQFGRNGPLNFAFPVAVKTGTTRNSRDNWTVGYTPSRIVGVWVGNADNTPMKDTSGVTGAGPIFHDVMLAAMVGIAKEPFVKPKDIVEREICALSGKLPTPQCPRILHEYFIRGTEPKEPDDLFQDVALDTRNGLRAGDGCPEQYIRHQVFAVFPPELRRWARENGWKQTPMAVSPLCSAAADRDSDAEQWLTITRPANGDTFQLDPLIPDQNEKIVFEAAAGADIKSIEWWVNGQRVGSATPPNFRFPWTPTEGEWLVEARASDIAERVSITVTTPSASPSSAR